MPLDTAGVRARLDELARLDPGDASRWATGRRWTEAELAAFERVHFRLPRDYRAWLADVGDGGAGFVDDGLRSLASQPTHALAAAARRFRVAGDARPSARGAIGGQLYLGTLDHCAVYLVTTGARAGEVWIDGRGYGDNLLARHGTFAELVERWLRQVTDEVTAALVPRRPEMLEAVAPGERFGVICGELVPWLRAGPAPLVEAFVAAGRRRRAMELLIDTIERTRRWETDPVLAARAAELLVAIDGVLAEPADDLDRALDAMYDADPPDLAPARVADMIAAHRRRRDGADERITRHSMAWLQAELIRTGRIDEALEVWRHRSYLYSSDWVVLARQLIAAGHPAAAFAAFDVHPLVSDRRDFDDRSWKRAWLHHEAGERDAARVWMERAVAAHPELARDLAQLAANAETPASLGWEALVARPDRARRGSRDHALIALLYGIAGDAEHMADVAISALSRPAVEREPALRDHHRAHLRMARALGGHRDPERAPIYLRDYRQRRRELAMAILQRTGDLAISFATT